MSLKGLMQTMVHRWRTGDAKYVWWRGANYVLLGVLVGGVVAPVLNHLAEVARYRLSADTVKIVGHTDKSLSGRLSYDAKKQEYHFNKDAVETGADAGLPARIQKAAVGAADKSNSKTYALDIPNDFQKGVTYYDTNSQLSFKLVPQFGAMPAKQQDGHLVFPLKDGNQAVYSLKNNGLKEDIVVPQARANDMTLNYELQLPKSLAAKIIPDSGGAVGIYSANPALFGDISYGSPEDQARVEKAREAAEKNTLVYGLPAPVIRDVSGKSPARASAKFVLNGTQLSVVATGLKSIKGAFTIDPSVVFTSTTDFQNQGNNEGMINFGTSGQITRGGLTGGSNAAWGSTTDWSALAGTAAENTEDSASVFYNGYLYVAGGLNRLPSSHELSDVRFAPVNSNGTLGTWAATSSMPATVTQTTALAYNGYFYVLGGSSSSTSTTTVYYTAINSSNGTLSSGWQTTTSLPAARRLAAAAVYDGFIYTLGGTTSGSPGASNLSAVYSAPIKADGSLGTWTSTTSLSYARARLTASAYNGYLYIFGGANATPAFVADVQYAKINADGTLGSWITTNSFTTARYGHMSGIYNGYAYVYGGWTGSIYRTDVQYAQVNANGSLGTWKTTGNALSAGRDYVAGGVYNGYLYLGGGYDGTSNYNDMQYAAIDPAGQTNAYTTSGNTFTNTRRGEQVVAYNGFLYVMGGNNTGATMYATVQAAAINTDGSIGAFTSTGMTSFTTGRAHFSAVAYDGNMYVLGGCITTLGSCGTTTNDLASVYMAAIASNGTIGAWTAQTSFNTVRFGLTAFAYNGTMYVLGGNNGGAFRSDIQYQAMGSGGTLTGSWTTSSFSLPTATSFMGSAVVGNVLYLVGGCTANGANSCTAATNNVLTATITTSGGVGGDLSAAPSTTGNSAFTNGRGQHEVVAINGYLYLTGGQNNGTYYADTQYAPINSNGTVGSWATAAATLSAATAQGAAAAYNGTLYVASGVDTTNPYNTIQYATVNNGGGGSNSAWSVGANSLPAATLLNTATAYNGYVYSVGGNDGNNATINTVRYSPLAASGDFGAFSTDSHTFTTARQLAGAVAYNGYLYVLGGENDTGSVRYGDTQYAPIGGSGALTANFASTNSFVTGTGSDTGRRGICAVAYNGYLYAGGGYDGTSNHADIRYAAINSNGTVGSWADSGNNFTTGRSKMGCFVANGYLYIVGGDAGGTKYNDVQSAQINSNGTLGAWSYTTSFTTGRSNAIVGYSNGFAYIAVGDGSSSSLSDTQFAPVHPGGTLGAWQQSTTSFGGSCVGLQGTGVVYNGALYRLGGYSAGACGVLTETGYAPLNVISRSARYSKLVDLGSPVSVSSISYSGMLPTNSSTPGVTPILIRTAGSNGVFGSQTASGAITAGATACLATSQNYVRYLEVTILMDGSGSQAILPDVSGTYSNVTDFTVNYITPHPVNNIRMRTGQTLQTGNLSPFDTCF